MIYIDNNLCTGCAICLDACSRGALTISGRTALVDESVCTECGRCAEVCPTRAIVLRDVFHEATTAQHTHAAAGARDPRRAGKGRHAHCGPHMSRGDFSHHPHYHATGMPSRPQSSRPHSSRPQSSRPHSSRPHSAPPDSPYLSREEEMALLKSESQRLRSILDSIEQRLAQLEACRHDMAQSGPGC